MGILDWTHCRIDGIHRLQKTPRGLRLLNCGMTGRGQTLWIITDEASNRPVSTGECHYAHSSSSYSNHGSFATTAVFRSDDFAHAGCHCRLAKHSAQARRKKSFGIISPESLMPSTTVLCCAAKCSLTSQKKGCTLASRSFWHPLKSSPERMQSPPGSCY